VESVTFPSLIDDLFISVRPLADGNGIELSTRHDGTPHRIRSDPRRVRQILLNLLSNAIKFGDSKPVEVCTAAREDGGVEVLVRDHGIGIPLEHQSRIFDEFVQLTRTSAQGTGLGLPISRRLAELLGGSLTVQSSPGTGSTFRLLLPAEVDEGTHALATDAGVGPRRHSDPGSSGLRGDPRQDLLGNPSSEPRVL